MPSVNIANRLIDRLSTVNYYFFMTLSEYLKANKVSQSKFARRCGMSRAAICRIVAGNRFPTPETMRRIFLATDGQVKADDFFTAAMQKM